MVLATFFASHSLGIWFPIQSRLMTLYKAQIPSAFDSQINLDWRLYRPWCPNPTKFLVMVWRLRWDWGTITSFIRLRQWGSNFKIRSPMLKGWRDNSSSVIQMWNLRNGPTLDQGHIEHDYLENYKHPKISYSAG